MIFLYLSNHNIFDRVQVLNYNADQLTPVSMLSQYQSGKREIFEQSGKSEESQPWD